MPLLLLLVAAGAAMAIASSRHSDHQDHQAAAMVLMAPFVVRFQLPEGPARDLFTSPYPGTAANAYEALRRQLLTRGSHGRLSLYANTPSSSIELRVEIL